MIQNFYLFLPILVWNLLFLGSCSSEVHQKTSPVSENILPLLEMPENKLSFNTIQGYENYRIIATHYRRDKEELRYILANPIAFNAWKQREFPLPQGSKVVKIGWKTKPMKKFGAAIEAKRLQRIEFMVKDSIGFAQNPGNWGYARFVKTKNSYQPWQKGTNGCISCHQSAGNTHDYLFTHFQAIF